MRTIPPVRAIETEQLRTLLKKLPAGVVNSGPIPTGFGSQSSSFTLGQVGHEIDSEPELMRTLPWPRFRRFPADKLTLPLGAAESLENLETELRSLGLIGPDEIICQADRAGRKFRVQKAGASVNRVSIHSISPNGAAGLFSPRPQGSAVGENALAPRVHIINKRRSRPAL